MCKKYEIKRLQFLQGYCIFVILGVFQPVYLLTINIPIRAATILRLLGNETIQFNTRGKKSEPGLRKQLNIDVKSTTKFNFFFKYMNIYIYILLI